MKKIMLVFGTRPEAIKMAPLVNEFMKHPEHFDVVIAVSGQHREMLDQVLELFDIHPHYDLDIMKEGQDLYDITSRILMGMKSVFLKEKPDFVFVHGDTTTSMAVALAAFYQQIQVCHVEAGLRTGSIYSPWPEEMNRQITGRLASYHFAPTSLSRDNLLRENVSDDSIIVTGNTVIDALLQVLEKIKNNSDIQCSLKDQIRRLGYDIDARGEDKKIVLITGHRRENFGDGFISICRAIRDLCEKYPHIDFVYPMHLNPNVRKPIQTIFADNDSPNMFFMEPLDYLPFIFLMERSFIILTDSGGVQEEAPALGKPVLVMRDTTERPEAVAAGTVRLVGTNYDTIVDEFSVLVESSERYKEMSRSQNPYGDGKACARIVETIMR